MRAVVIESFGDLAELKLKDVATPAPATDELLVRIHAAAVNPSDTKNVLGLMNHTTLPRIPGRDFAGVVEQGPAHLVGMEVWGTGGESGFIKDGAHAEYIVVPVGAVQPKPASLSMLEASSVGVGYITAWAALVDAAAAGRGDVVLVVGGSGAVGSAAIAIARWRGASVLATVRGTQQYEIMQRFKPDAMISLEEQNGSTDEVLAAEVQQLTGGRGVDVVVDTVGGVMFEPCLLCLAPRGRLVEISATGERRVSFDLLNFYRKQLRLYGVNTLALDMTACAQMLGQLKPGFEDGSLVAPVVESFPLEQVVAAYEHVHQRKTLHKVVFHIA